jgi:hypothetical protein
MADLVTVTRKSDGEEIIVDVDTAQLMLEKGELIVPPNTGNALTLADVMGNDYETGDLTSRI